MQTAAGEPGPNPQRDPGVDNTREVLRYGLGITVVGFVAVVVQTLNSGALIALLWALALYMLGVSVGFLFSVSWVVENTAAAAGSTPSAIKYVPNTGLAQIADWLTKIIVGLTLVELVKIPPAIASFSAVIAASIGNTDGVKGLAYAMIIFFPIVGFLGMYLSTRLYLNEGIRNAEARLFAPSADAALDNRQASLQAPPNRGVPDAVKSTAEDIVTVPLQKLSNPSDIAAWARAKSVLGAWNDAIRAFDRAVKLNRRDPKLRLDYAVALFNSGAPSEQVIAQIEEGLKFVDPADDPQLVSRLRGNLVMAYLYLPAPGGFTKAIEAVEELIASPLLPKRPEIYFNAACAYGQKYGYLKKSGSADPEELESARQKVLEYTRKTLELDPTFVESFRMVSDPNYPNKWKQDNDLEILVDDADFKALVWKDATPTPTPRA